MVNVLQKVLNKISTTTKNAAGTISDYSYAKKNDEKTRGMIDSLAISKAKKNYQKKTGMEMTPGVLRTEGQSLIADKNITNYINDRDKTASDMKKNLKVQTGMDKIRRVFGK